MTNTRGGGVFEVSDKYPLRVTTPGLISDVSHFW